MTERQSKPPGTAIGDAARALLSAFAHDIRNPLSAIVTNLEFAQRVVHRQLDGGKGDPDLADAMDDTIGACDGLRRVIANFELMVQGAEPHGQSMPTSLDVVIADVMTRSQRQAILADVRLELGSAPLGRSAHLVGSLLGLALENLIANALQHAPLGSTIVVTTHATPSAAHIEVRDRGGAVAHELRALSTSELGQLERSRQKELRYGRGLGLLAARLAAEATGLGLELGGEGDDSTMTLIVPLSR
jgi:signal transduction histidine kinase